MDTEIVYLGHDNSIDLILEANGVAVSLSGATRMTLSMGSTLIDSDNGSSDAILWAKGGYATGEIHLILGNLTITPGVYSCPLVVYDSSNDDGVVWGKIPIEVVAEVEAAAPTA